MLRQIVVENQVTDDQILEIVNQSPFDFTAGFTAGQSVKKTVNFEMLKELIASADPQKHITREEMEAYRKAFETNYKAVNGAQVTENWYPDIVVKWSAFKELATADVADPDTLALRFIHCYDTAEERWYLTIQRFRITFPPEGPSKGGVYPLTPILPPQANEIDSLTAIYQHPDGTGYTTPSNANIHVRNYHGLNDYYYYYYYDKDYLDRVEDAAGPLLLDVHAFGVTFSYREILELHAHNNPKNLSDDKFHIVFFSLSYDMGPAPMPPATGIDSNVQWPHSIAMHMRRDGADCLHNKAVVMMGAAGKASDLGGICPPRTASIVWQL